MVSQPKSGRVGKEGGGDGARRTYAAAGVRCGVSGTPRGVRSEAAGGRAEEGPMQRLGRRTVCPAGGHAAAGYPQLAGGTFGLLVTFG